MRDGEVDDNYERAIRAHVAPFLVWLLIMVLPGLPPAWNYALRSGTTAWLACRLRPWRGYEPWRLTQAGWAVGAGVLVFLVWIIPESDWMERFPSVRDGYLRWAVLPWGRLPDFSVSSPYAPAHCGWTLAGIRLAGSALVIAPVEEFFWRGFLYRWWSGRNFLAVDPGTFKPGPLLLVSLAFGFEHDRWLAGALAGLVYALVMIKSRNIWAAGLAHVTTNLLLGVYVLVAGAYRFW